MRLLASALTLVAACGRVGFDRGMGSATGDGGGDGADTASGMPDAQPLALCTTTYQGAVLCDDFETDLGKWFSNLDGTNQVVLDTTHARSGTGAAHVIALETGAARLIANVLGGLTSGTVYARFYIWVPGAAVTDSLSILHMVSNMLPYPGMVLDVTPGTLTIQSTIDGSFGADTPTALPRDRWVCIQWALAIGASGSATTTVDGTTSAAFVGNTIPDANGYTDLHVGVYLMQATPFELWLDDVVADLAPVPCD